MVVRASSGSGGGGSPTLHYTTAYASANKVTITGVNGTVVATALVGATGNFNNCYVVIGTPDGGANGYQGLPWNTMSESSSAHFTQTGTTLEIYYPISDNVFVWYWTV